MLTSISMLRLIFLLDENQRHLSLYFDVFLVTVYQWVSTSAEIGYKKKCFVADQDWLQLSKVHPHDESILLIIFYIFVCSSNKNS